MTIKQLHAKLMTDQLKDDPRINFSKRIVTCEMLARERGWQAEITEEYLAIRAVQLMEA